MKMTLLEIVQDILNDMDSDEVNSISDTVESQQVAQIVRTTFFELINRKTDWPHLHKIVPLTNVSDSSKPTHLLLPERAVQLDFLNYDKRTTIDGRPVYSELKYKYPDDFLKYVNDRNTDNDNVIIVNDFNGITLNIVNDKAPEYWTSFDDKYIILDSFIYEISSTVVGAFTQAQLRFTPLWAPTDTYVPDLPVEAFPGLLAEAKSTCFLVLKQMANEKAEQQSKRQYRMTTQRGWIANGGIRYPDYGRRKGEGYGSHFK